MTTAEQFEKEMNDFVEEAKAFEVRIKSFTQDFVERVDKSDLTDNEKIGVTFKFIAAMKELIK